MDDSTLLELIPAYALGVLATDERAAVDQLLARSELACRLLQEYQTVADGMALTVPPRRAPADLTDKFMARLAQLPAAKSSSSSTGSRKTAEAALAGRPRIQPTLVRPPARVPHWLGIAAAAAIIALVLTGLSISRVLAPSLSATANQTAAQVAMIQAILNNPAGKLSSFVVPGTQSAPMVVTIYSLPDSPTVILDNSAMPALDNDQQYELWAIESNQPPVDAKVFDGQPLTPGTPGSQPPQYSKVLVALPKPMASYQTLAITVEPHGGSAAPTSKPILALAVSQ